MKTILVPFRDDEVARSAVTTACAVARKFNGYIEGLFIQTPPLVYASEGIAIGGYVTQLADEERRRADDAKTLFDSLMQNESVAIDGGAEGPRASWRQVDGLSEQIVGEYGRLFDLVVIGRENKNSSPDWGVMCESALFDSGRLVLIAPPNMPDNVGSRVAILWNGSTESARTIAMAMPFIRAAEQVMVLAVEGVMVPGPSAEQVAEKLALTGANVSFEIGQLDGRTTGEAVLEEAHASGANLLIKGAYAHSRLRQTIFGGPTRHILSHTELPVLMAH